MSKEGYKDIPIGGLIKEAGSSKKNPTGSWRTYRPIYLEDKCIQCMFCFAYCPDSAIEVEDGEVVGVDYDFCKGCLICSEECPVDAFEVKSESEIEE